MNSKNTTPTQVGTGGRALYFGFDAMTQVGGTLNLGTPDGKRASISLPAGTTQAIIPPGGVTGRPLRRAWEKAGNLVTMICDDNGPHMGGSPGPDAFDAVTMKWALRSQDNIILWACGFDPHIVNAAQAIVSRGKPTLFIVTSEPQEIPWLDFIRKWKRNNAQTFPMLTKNGSFDCLYGRARNDA